MPWLVAKPFAIETSCGIRFSFQRYRARTAPFSRPPSSLGALPCGARNGELLLPIAEGEAVWIGCELPPSHASIKISLQAYWQGTTAASTSVKATSDAKLVVIAGLPRGSLFKSIGLRRQGSRLTTLVLSLSNLAGSRLLGFNVLVCRTRTFERLTARRVPTLDSSTGYGGWPLP